VHGFFILRGRLSREAFRELQKTVHGEATRDATLQRKARDLFLQNPRNQALHVRLRLGRSRGGRAPQVQPGCRSCGYGEFSGLPSYMGSCPMCHARLRDTQKPRLQLAQGRQQ
jgi:hypothetical protein